MTCFHQRPMIHAIAFLMLVALAGPLAAAPPDKDAKGAKALPDVRVVESAVAAVLAKKADYRPGDFLVRSQLAPVFAELARLGWQVSDREEIVAKVTDDRDFVAQQFQTPRGKEFMRSVASDTAHFEKLDRLAATRGGDRQVRDIIKLPNGPDVLEALVNSQGGKDITKRLSNGPLTSDYNKPTGKIYNEKQFVERLKESHANDLKQSPKTPTVNKAAR